MPDFEVFHYAVPAGFDPLIQPTKPEERVPKDKIKIEPLQKGDLKDWAAICYEAFPDVFWDMVEKPSRPSLAVRIELMAQHFRPWISQPGYHALKAVHADTGEIMGIAGWHEIGKHRLFPTTYDTFPAGVQFHDAFVPCAWRDDLVGPLKFQEKEGWTDDDVQQMYAHHSAGWFQEFEKYDVGRIRELKGQPHWYLAPLCIRKAFQAKGVGMALMRYGLDRADAADPPQAAVLEAIPSARPMYYHLGFQPTEEHGDCKDTQCVRPPQRKG